MTLRTITFDDSIYKLVPLEPTEETLRPLSFLIDEDLATIKKAYCDVIAAAPEYQDKIADLESQDFYEVMQAYRHDKGTGSDTFEAVKQWLRNPVYEYQDTKKDE